VATQNSELSASDQGDWVRHRPTGGPHLTEMIKATAAYNSKLIKPCCSRLSERLTAHPYGSLDRELRDELNGCADMTNGTLGPSQPPSSIRTSSSNYVDVLILRMASLVPGPPSLMGGTGGRCVDGDVVV
jgi:hypothetical protein